MQRKMLAMFGATAALALGGVYYSQGQRGPGAQVQLPEGAGRDALVRFDPKTEKFQSWAIPSGVGIVRNFGVTKSGNLIIHQSSSNRVGLVEIGK